jgi:hypothetical protein
MRTWSVVMVAPLLSEPVVVKQYRGLFAQWRAEREWVARVKGLRQTEQVYRQMEMVVDGVNRGLAVPDFKSDITFQVRAGKA